jgi:hypothetical protein
VFNQTNVSLNSLNGSQECRISTGNAWSIPERFSIQCRENEIEHDQRLIDEDMRVGWRRPINPTKSCGTACKAAVLLII